MCASATPLLEGFANALVFAAFGAIFVWVNLFVIGKLVLRRPEKPDEGDKGAVYECAEPAMGDAWIRFDIRFYTLSLIFLIFDIEVALLFPWAAVYHKFIDSGLGPAAFVEVAFFLVVLGVGLAYVWLRRDLEWTSVRPGRTVPEAVLDEGVVREPEPVAPALHEDATP